MELVRVRESAGDRVFLTVVYVFLSMVLIVILYPLVYIVSASISSPEAVISGQVWLWPEHLSFLGYKAVFDTPEVLTGYANSAFYAFFGTLVSVTLTIMMAYPLSRKSFYGRNALVIFMVFTMLFSGGLIPLYMVVKSLGLVNTRLALILPQAMAVWMVIIARTFFQTTIPDELAEAAQIDGCTDIGFMLRVVLPLSKPIIAVLVLVYAVGQWNAYFDALIYLSNENLFPLQLVLRNILILNTQSNMTDVTLFVKRQGMAELMKYSLIVIASLPVLVIYPFVQRHFVKGMLIGSVKG